MSKVRQKPTKIIRTNKSEIRIYEHYEEDPKKLRQAKEEFNRGLRYVAKQGGWLDALEERDAALVRLMCLFKRSKKNMPRCLMRTGGRMLWECGAMTNLFITDSCHTMFT